MPTPTFPEGDYFARADSFEINKIEANYNQITRKINSYARSEGRSCFDEASRGGLLPALRAVWVCLRSLEQVKAYKEQDHKS